MREALSDHGTQRPLPIASQAREVTLVRSRYAAFHVLSEVGE